MYLQLMDQNQIIATLRRHEHELNRKGVLHAALFGSIARGETGEDSDIDIVVDVDPSTAMSVYDYVDLKQFISSLFDQPVDIVSRHGLKTHVAPSVLAEAINAF